MNIAAYPKYESYRDSGVQWLGEIPSNWDVRRFRFLCSIGTGERNTEDKQEDGQYPFFVRSQTPERIDSYAYEGEAILTAGDGAGVGKVYHYVNGKFDFHQRVYKFSDFREVIGRYLYHYLVVNFASVALLGTAKSTVDSLRLPLIQDFPIAFPKDKISQSKIVEFLDRKCATINEAVRIKEEQIRLLAERRKILIQQAVTRGLNPNAPMKDSSIDWIGDVPEHWNIEKLGSMLTAVSEKNRPDLPLLSITREQGVIERDVEDQDSNHNFIPDDLSGYKVLREGQFGMNKMKAWQGSYGVSAHTGIVSPAYFIFDFAREVDPHFFNIAIRSKLYVSYFGSASDGVRIGQWDLNQSRMRQIPLLLPPLPEQRAIAAFLDRKCATIDEAISLKESQITALREYKTSLINAAVTGKIKVL